MFARLTFAVIAISLIAGCGDPLPPGGSAPIGLPTGGDNGAIGGADGGVSSGADTTGTTDSGETPGDDAAVGDGGGTTGDTGTKPSDAFTVPDVQVGPPAAKFTGYPAAELSMRIVGPSGRGHATVSGGVIEVAGVVFGNAEEITWNTTTGKKGNGHGAPFFQTDPIQLVPGDNLVTVTAKNKVETVTDRIVITYNPLFSFPDRLRANPRVLKVGKATDIAGVIGLGKASNIVKGSIKLFRVDADNNSLTTLGAMADTGNLSDGDEIAGDGLYSKKVKLTENAPGTVRLRASVDVQGPDGKTITAYSDVVVLDVVEEIKDADCNAVLAALKTAEAAGKKAGDGDAGRDAAMESLKAADGVAEVGPTSDGFGQAGTGAWVRFKSGLLGVVRLGSAGNRGGGAGGGSEAGGSWTGTGLAGDEALTTVEVGSKRALLLDPSAKELGETEVATTAAAMAKIACPAYTLDAPKDAAADLRWMRRWYDYGVIVTAAHGEAAFKSLADKGKYGWRHGGSQELLWTGHAVSCGYFGASGAPVKACTDKLPCGPEAECVVNQAGGGVCVDHLTADLRTGRMAFTSDGTYAVLPSFVGHHAEQRFPQSLAYLGACRSLFNGTLASEVIAAGAATVAGYNGYVQSAFAIKWGKSFFANAIEQKQLTGAAHAQIDDAANKGTWFGFVGAQNLNVASIEIMNPSWESGNIQGWLKDGDGRVVAKLGTSIPVDGKFMGIVSTGLGYTQQKGEMTQRFCVPAGKSKFSLWWKFFSEEFKEYCGSPYQDAFVVKFEGKPGNKTVVDVNVDSLCGKGDNGCFSCGSQHKGLTKADVSFDTGDVWMTPWVQGTADISPFAGNGNVLLRLYSTDVGDSIYDSAILMDKLEFE
jgi:hypothetical protein